MVLVALCLTIALGIAVAGFVAVCARTMELSNRSFCYTASTQLAETGLEEALWSLNQAYANPSSYDWSAAGWTKTGSTVTKSLTGFATNTGVPGSVTLQIDNCDYDRISNTTLPVITSHGISQMRDGIAIDRRLKVAVRPVALFSNAVAAVGTATPDNHLGNYVYFASAAGGLVDSYDSTQNSGDYDPSLVPGATPPRPVNRSDKAVVSGPYVYLYNTNVLGYVATANPSSYALWVYTNGGVTGLDPTTGLPSSLRIDNSRISNNANQSAFDLSQPSATNQLFGGAQTGMARIATGATSPQFWYSGLSGLALSGGDTLTIDGPVVIVVSGDFSIQDMASIQITADGSAQIYVTGNLNIQGLGINNLTKRPRKLALFSTSNSWYSQMNTTTPFCGVIYVPNMPLYVGSWSPATPNYDMTINGALVAKYVFFYDVPAVHYDLDLRNATFSSVSTPFQVSQWLSTTSAPSAQQ